MNNTSPSDGGLILYQAYGNLYAMTADHGTKRCRHSSSTSSSFAINNISSSDYIDDYNDDGTSCSSVSSSTRVVNSLFTNLAHDNQNMQTLHTRQTKILNLQVQLRDEYQNGLRYVSWKNTKDYMKI
nr:hypothetical protein [Tanacetum cinerariifolium]